MNKKEVNYIEIPVIPNINYALWLYHKENKRIKTKAICCIIALLGTVCVFVNSYCELSAFGHCFCKCIWFCSLIAILISDNPSNIFKLIFKVGKNGYCAPRIYHLDKSGFITGLFLGFVFFFSFPIIPCLITFLQSFKNMRSAKYYLSLNENRKQGCLTRL